MGTGALHRASEASAGSTSHRRAAFVVLALSWLVVLFDGVDTFMYGATIPSMTSDPSLEMSASLAGLIGSGATLGMLVGALAAGLVTDAIGRRRGMIACALVFSLASAVCALAPSAAVFGIARTVAGVGLGGLLPTAIAMVSEYAPDGSRNLLIAALMTAHQTGGIVAAILGITMLPAWGWRSLYWVGVAPLVLAVPLILALLPESLAFLLAKGRVEDARRTAARLGVPLPRSTSSARTANAERRSSATGRRGGLAALFRPDTIGLTLLFWGASFGGLLLVYGVSTWLPSLMGAEGFALGSSLAFLLVVNLGGIVGLLIAGPLADRLGPVRVAMFWFLMTAVAVFLLGVRLPTAAAYLVVFVSGVFLFSAQTMVYASVAHVFPTRIRATAIGWTTGIGRFGAVFGPWMGGQLFALGLERWGFAAFAAFALLSTAFLLTVLTVLRGRSRGPYSSTSASRAPHDRHD
ncbi:MFS transporter [Brachybacterium kimchii]|uniref:MFS transporter n=1 Tax=Brachybacterium kimchii TaxID=2942909 RepID=A0ABY4NAI1_9MICO|nr:MFS transporter [Brachybacterium kimchii]UQN30428.1 MFS transporter [Brachybacterium kimchii]